MPSNLLVKGDILLTGGGVESLPAMMSLSLNTVYFSGRSL